MGGKESKPMSLSYEEAVKRVTDDELSRLKSAYKRTAMNGGTISCNTFCREVLGETVPQQLAQQIFMACGGSSKGISFKDLLCSLVMLTKCNREEKIKFICSIYCNDTGSHVVRSDLQRCLQQTEGHEASRHIVNQCMEASDRMTCSDFITWLSLHQDATSITRWLLCSSANSTHSTASSLALDTPTFFQTLAGVTHLEESEIMELEKRYWTLKGASSTGVLDLAYLTPLLAPPLTSSLARGLFSAFDENRDGHIDFKEMACGISAACRGPQTERHKFLFKMFDRDRDGLLDREELTTMLTALLAACVEEREEWDAEGVCCAASDEQVSRLVEAVLLEHDPGGRGGLLLEDYLIWTLDSALTCTVLAIIFQVCHIVLGLRPSSAREEGDIVLSWLHRSETRESTVGHFWYIISMDWWNCWANYVLGQGDSCGGSSSSPVSASSSGAVKLTKLQKKTAHDRGHVASSENGVTIRSMSCLSTLSLDDALSVGVNDGETNHFWGCGPASAASSALSLLQQQQFTSPVGSSARDDGSNGSVGGRHQRMASQASEYSVASSQDSCGLWEAVPTAPPLSPRKVCSATNLLLHSGRDSSRSSACSSPAPSPQTPRRHPPCPRPPAIDNSALVEPATLQHKALQLTWEGGRLRRCPSLVRGRDFVLLPERLWKTMHQWYGGAPALPRQVIHGPVLGSVELELYPITLHILRHAAHRPIPPPPHPPAGGGATHWMGVMGGYGVAAISRIADSAPGYVSSLAGALTGAPKRYLAHVASFSRLATLSQVHAYLAEKLRLAVDDMRLWHVRNEGLLLLEDCHDETLSGAGVVDLSEVLLEVRNKDLTWPEEMSQITTTATHNVGATVRQNSIKTGNVDKGMTGLNNLGNTCFLNAALQCCSNTPILTSYFLRNLHLYELNPGNPSGTQGHVAREYGCLLHQIWSGEARCVAPLKLRWTIGKWSGNFTGADQHDSQELLSFLLDGLHEDLNRVQHKPYTELKDSEGRPDTLVAQEAWENHIVRNKSIIVDLFHGQLKSKVTCSVCGHQSARFDPFTYLSLQLPMESYTHLEVVLVRLDGSVPVKYGLRLVEDSRYRDIKMRLHAFTGVPPHHILLADLQHHQPVIKYVPADEYRLRASSGALLYAYELPSPLHLDSANSSKTSRPSTGRTDGRTNGGRATSECATVADFVKNSRAEQDPSVTEGQQAQLRELQVLQQRQEQQQSSGRSAKDRQTLAQIQRATTAVQPHTLAVTSDVLDGRDMQRGISPAPSPEPSLLQGDPAPSGPPTPVSDTSSLLVAEPPSPPSPAHSLSVHCEADLAKTNKGFVIAYHRKLIRQEVYFLASQKCRPSLFGLPIVVPCSPGSSHKSLYQSVWTQVSRLVTPLPPSEVAAGINHAADCDDSLGYEFPFVLRMVDREGMQCAVCPWYDFCRGCCLNCDEEVFPAHTVAFLAIDWDSTALHLRYQSTLEKSVHEDPSVCEQRRRHTEPVSLQHCLEAFTAEETLDYSCQHCRKMQPAAKKLQIWRLPPLLIVHLKRFQFVGEKWIKSQKLVQFPLHDLDPSEYLASVPRETLALHRAQQEGRLGDDLAGHSSLPVLLENQMSSALGRDSEDGYSLPPLLTTDCSNDSEDDVVCQSSSPSKAVTHQHPPRRRVRNGSVLYGDALQDFHQHRLLDGEDSLTLHYDLYAVVCHTGVMEAGHYVCYAKSRTGRWIYFNDSSCKEVSEKELDLSSAYLLFYERRGLDPAQYLPSVSGRHPYPLTHLDSEAEDEYKKQCSVM